MVELIEQFRPQIPRLCQHYNVRRLDVFGSALRDGFDPVQSDLDFVVEFNNL
jgi:predicted nucleotidyltransferase